ADAVEEKEFNNTFNCIREDMMEIIKEIKLNEYIKADGDLMINNIEQRVDEIDTYFSNTLGMLVENIQIFTSSIDDREDYKKHIEKLEEEEKVINQIKEATSDFMVSWKEVCNDKTDMSKETA
ncbi:MAG: hypothetical protein K2M91_16235, partial [Lachnospiraceae bacterium]|nr:hypothetical protein [Lachnospiraceae bacterium]